MAEDKYGDQLISWDFSEFIEHERTRGWYVMVIIVGGLLLLYSVITVNFLFAMIIIIVAVVLFLRHSEAAKNIVFTVYEDGIRVGDKFYDFDEIKDFYIIYEPPEVKSLYLNFNSIIQPRIQIPLQETNPIELRKILLEYLEEDLDQDEEPVSDAMGRFFKL